MYINMCTAWIFWTQSLFSVIVHLPVPVTWHASFFTFKPSSYNLSVMAIKSNFQKFLQTLATNLHNTRVSKNLSISTVAKAVKASPATLRRIERGEHNVRIELLGRLCKFYNVSAGNMATEQKAPHEPRRSKKSVWILQLPCNRCKISLRSPMRLSCNR